MYKFIRHNISYQPFDIFQSFSLTSAFSKEKILLLTKPQIIFQSNINSKRSNNFNNYSNNLLNVLPNNNSNFVTMTSQESVNNIEIEQQLLGQKSKMRPRRRHHTSYYTKNKYNQNKSSLNHQANQSITEPVDAITNHKKNQMIVTENNIKSISSEQILYNKTSQNNITIQNPLNIHELSTLISVSESEIIKWLFLKGISVTINQTLDVNIATSVAQNYGFIVQNSINSPKTSTVVHQPNMDVTNTISRLPIVTVLGYTNHGKTTLLQALQKTKQKNKEIRGTTQLMGVHEIEISTDNKDQKVIFLDTPGHEAFMSMRWRSIQMSDIAILVIAADDTLRSQTIEIIKYIKNVNIPPIVVINKIDKTQANIGKIKAQLTAYNLISQDCVDPMLIVPVSSTNYTNIDQLISKIILIAEQQNLRANPDEKASGIVIDAFLDKNKGTLASVLIQKGTLAIGDFLVASNSFTKVRTMLNHRGSKVQKAFPSTVVEIGGFSQVPKAGSLFTTVSNEKEAKKTALEYKDATTSIVSLQKRLHSRVTTSVADVITRTTHTKQLNIILKTDTQASIEAILLSFSKLPQEKVQLNVISIASGMITETDIKLAIVSGSILIGFNSFLAQGIRLYGQRNNIVIYEYKLIAHLLDDIKNMMDNLSEPEYIEQFTGAARVNSVFSLSRGTIAGCIVTSGKIAHNSKIRVIRNNTVIHEGMLKSLRHMKEDIQEATEGKECGIMAASFQEWHENDNIEFYCKQRRTKSL